MRLPRTKSGYSMSSSLIKLYQNKLKSQVR
nr:MAG TPA: Low temperature viability protein [Caudoviricetes sp.]